MLPLKLPVLITSECGVTFTEPTQAYYSSKMAVEIMLATSGVLVIIVHNSACGYY